jgi:hypothetical protein
VPLEDKFLLISFVIVKIILITTNCTYPWLFYSNVICEGNVKDLIEFFIIVMFPWLYMRVMLKI